jgi:hypothetical protein
LVVESGTDVGFDTDVRRYPPDSLEPPIEDLACSRRRGAHAPSHYRPINVGSKLMSDAGVITDSVPSNNAALINKQIKTA